MQKVILMVVHTPGEREVRASCATCRWAEAFKGDGLERTAGLLQCRALAPGHGYAEDDPEQVARPARVWREDPESASGLAVAPTFGCVQWEGKE